MKVGRIKAWYEEQGTLFVEVWWDAENFSVIPAPATYCTHVAVCKRSGKVFWA